MKYLLSLVLLLILPPILISQISNNIWYFGTNAGLDFSTNPPTSITGSLAAEEGTASIADSDGNLLFYTNGMNIWDRNHNIMPNGSGLLGGFSATQAAIIAPWPGTCHKYFVFTVDDHAGSGQLRYSVVDMCLNNGNGDIETATKNILLSSPMGEKMTTVLHANGSDIWVLAHKLTTNQFMAYLVTSTGLNTTPVISSIGSVHPSNMMIGPMRISHNSQKLVTSCTFGNICEMFDFNTSNGQITNMVNLAQLYSLPNGVYGIEFSPNDSILYLTTCQSTNLLLQLDLTSGIKTTLASMSGNYHFGGLQMGSDQKIYMARRLQNYLAVIQSPNISGIGCQYIPAGQMLASGTMSFFGLITPTQYSYLTPTQNHISLGNDTTICQSDSLILKLGRECSTSFLWQNASVDSFHIITQAGTYWVQVSNVCHVFSDTIQVNLDTAINIFLGNDTVICRNDSILLDAGQSGITYLWSTGEITQTIVVSQAGDYWLRVGSGSCIGIDTIHVTINELPLINLGKDTTICENADIILDAGYPGAAHQWSTGDTTAWLVVNYPGKYWVNVLENNCLGTDTILVQVTPNPEPHILGDTILCGDSMLILDVVPMMEEYLWSTGSNSSGILVTEPGKYWVRVKQGQCFGTDTIYINQLLPFDLGDQIALCEGEKRMLQVPNTIGSYLWSTGDTASFITVESPGTYWITVTYGSCHFSDNIEVQQINGSIYFPNSFTPNQDGLNDEFKAIGEGITSIELRIFNRWGEQVFLSNDPAKGWNGVYRGKLSMNGIYAWKAEYTTLCTDGTKQIKYGKVLILK